jgi:hypothetical protein
MPNSEYRIFFYLNHITNAAGVQTAFQWDPSWDLLESYWGCRSSQLTTTAPDPDTNGGPVTGTLSTVFDCVSGPSLVRIGFMDFVAGTTGCLSQIQSDYPNGNHVLDCSNAIDLVDPANPVEALRFGRICVDVGGHVDGSQNPRKSGVERETGWESRI